MNIADDCRNARNSAQKIVKSAGERISKNKNQSKTGMITKASCHSGLRIETDDGSRETSFD